MVTIFKRGKRNITNIKTQHFQIVITITNRILKFKLMIKEPLVASHTFFFIITFRKINSFTLFNCIVIQQL